MIPILSSNAWREFHGVPVKRGKNQTTHLAVIENADGKLHRCYVKLCPPNWPTPLTEAFGWLLAEALSLPRPEFAALVFVPLDKLRAHLNLDQHWLNYPEAISFCASAIDGNTPTHWWQWLAHLRTRGLYKRPEVARIAAFDQWAENRDRNNSNLLVKRDGTCVPIDNEFILYSALWHGKVPFNVAPANLLAEGKKHLGPVQFQRFTVEVARQGQLHDNAFKVAKVKLKQMVDTLVPDATKATALWTLVENDLASRADPAWLANQLGVIV